MSIMRINQHAMDSGSREVPIFTLFRLTIWKEYLGENSSINRVVELDKLQEPI